jgi:hypothetical protein
MASAISLFRFIQDHLQIIRITANRKTIFCNDCKKLRVKHRFLILGPDFLQLSE